LIGRQIKIKVITPLKFKKIYLPSNIINTWLRKWWSSNAAIQFDIWINYYWRVSFFDTKYGNKDCYRISRYSFLFAVSLIIQFYATDFSIDVRYSKDILGILQDVEQKFVIHCLLKKESFFFKLNVVTASTFKSQNISKTINFEIHSNIFYLEFATL